MHIKNNPIEASKLTVVFFLTTGVIVTVWFMLLYSYMNFLAIGHFTLGGFVDWGGIFLLFPALLYICGIIAIIKRHQLIKKSFSKTNLTSIDFLPDRIKFNFNMMIKNGNVIVGKQGMPLGYTITGDKKEKKMIKDAETEDIVNDMWDNIKNTGSIRQTLIYINNKYNLDICYDSMRHYLMNEKYYGEYRGVKDYCPAYVTKEEFDKVQSMIKRNVRMNKRHDYIFSGLLKCPICGHKLAGFTSKTTKSHGKKVDFKYPSYRCNYKYQKKCSYNKRPVEATIEKYLLANIENEINKYKIEIKEIKEKKEKVPKVNINKLKKKLERLTDLYIDGKIGRDKYDLEYDKINNQIIAYEGEKETLLNTNYNDLEKLFDKKVLSLYTTLSNQNKRMFWASFIDYIEINQNNEYHIHFKK